MYLPLYVTFPYSDFLFPYGLLPSKSMKTPVLRSHHEERAPAYVLTWRNGIIKVNVIYELWREIRQSRIPLISEHFPIKSKLWLFLSRQWWNPQPFLKNCIRIVTGFHQFYCLFFLWPAEQYFTMYFIIWHIHFQCILDSCFQTVLEVLKADTCRPECTWEFCKANPNEICSAR